MRNPKRIDIFLELVDWDKLQERWTLNIKEEIYPPHHKYTVKQIYTKYEDIIRDYWEQYYDQRFGQVLINLGLVLDGFFIWNDEEDSILKAQGLEPREYTLWGNVFDKEGNRLEETNWILVKDLETDHIQNILKANGEYRVMISDNMKKILQDELNRRSSSS